MATALLDLEAKLYRQAPQCSQLCATGPPGLTKPGTWQGACDDETGFEYGRKSSKRRGLCTAEKGGNPPTRQIEMPKPSHRLRPSLPIWFPLSLSTCARLQGFGVGRSTVCRSRRWHSEELCLTPHPVLLKEVEEGLTGWCILTYLPPYLATYLPASVPTLPTCQPTSHRLFPSALPQTHMLNELKSLQRMRVLQPPHACDEI